MPTRIPATAATAEPITKVTLTIEVAVDPHGVGDRDVLGGGPHGQPEPVRVVTNQSTRSTPAVMQ